MAHSTRKEKKQKMAIELVRKALYNAVDTKEESVSRFFKTETGSYAEADIFIGITDGAVRAVAKKYKELNFFQLEELLQSKVNQERLLALIILTQQYKKADSAKKETIYQFYLNHLGSVNNWNLVDISAHLIVGAHLLDKDKTPLMKLAQSKNMWERRISIVSTWYFIREKQLDWTFKIAEILMQDNHDLIHKAVGWMLREAGKKDGLCLTHFLDRYGAVMPRVMLRYAIEKFPKEVRKMYLSKTKEQDACQ